MKHKLITASLGLIMLLTACTKEQAIPENDLYRLDKFLFCTTNFNGKDHTNYGYYIKMGLKYDGVTAALNYIPTLDSSYLFFRLLPAYNFAESGTISTNLDLIRNGSEIPGEYRLPARIHSDIIFQDGPSTYFIDRSLPFRFKINSVKQDSTYGRYSEGEFSFHVISLTRTTLSPVTGKFRAIIH
jgi:hypothetical protein